MRSSYSLKDSVIQDLDQWIDQDTIIFVNIEDTIITPKSLMFSHRSHSSRSLIDIFVSLGKTMPRYKDLVSIWYQQRKIQLVENDWTKFMHKARNKGALVYGLYSIPIHLHNIEERVYRELYNLGIIFTQKVNQKERLTIKSNSNWSPEFYKGIVFVGSYSKSRAVMRLIQDHNIALNKVLIISHMKRDLYNINKAFKIFDIDLRSILYLGVQRIPGKPDPRIINIQKRELIKNGRWLEDEEVASYLPST